MICTFISDFGFKDPYIAMVKGLFYRHFPNVQLIDISHQVQDQDIIHSAFLSKSSFAFFPEKSIHLILTDVYYQQEPKLVFANYQNHWFVAPDNGIIPLISDGHVELGYEVEVKNHFFESAVIICEALSNNKSPDYQSVQLNRKIWSLPTNGDHFIRGIFFHIDKFGNLISNISKTLFESVCNNRKFEIVVRNNRIKIISDHYAGVPDGEIVAIFGSTGYLEISIRKGSASALLGLATWDMISVEFFD